MSPSAGVCAITRRAGLISLIFCLSLTANRRQAHDGAESKREAVSDKVYEPGGAVTRPKLIHYVEPEFSPKSKEAFVEGTVKISVVVTPDGVPTSSHVVSGLNAEEDKTAMDALKQWRFKPGTKDGQAVNVRVTVEIDFHLL